MLLFFLEGVEGCCSFDTRICTEWSISHGRSWASNLIPWWRSHKAPRAVWGLATPHEVSWLEKASLPLPTFPNGHLCMPFGLRRHMLTHFLCHNNSTNVLCHNMIPQPLSPVVASNPTASIFSIKNDAMRFGESGLCQVEEADFSRYSLEVRSWGQIWVRLVRAQFQSSNLDDLRYQFCA